MHDVSVLMRPIGMSILLIILYLVHAWSGFAECIIADHLTFKELSLDQKRTFGGNFCILGTLKAHAKRKQCI